MFSEKDIKRFSEKYLVCEKTGCWIWAEGKWSDGYGQFGYSIDKDTWKPIRAHRASWIIHRGAIPNDLWVLHKCDTPLCVNPEHLFLGTNQDNMDDMMAKGRGTVGLKNGKYTHPECTPRGDRHGSRTSPGRLPRGEEHHNTKLTWDQVESIRSEYPYAESAEAMGKIYGVSGATILRIVREKVWKAKNREAAKATGVI
jgi:hypothetical protein